MSGMTRSWQRLRHPRQRHQALLDAERKPKPKGREALKTLIEAFDKTRDSDGIYHQPLVPIKPVYHPPVIAKPNKPPKLNKNRFGPSPFFGLQSAGMPGNEETDPGRW